MVKSAERFAARFAAREAFFKALRQFMPDKELQFFNVCKSIIIEKNSGGPPSMAINWHMLLTNNQDLKKASSIIASISWTHTKTTATAIIILQPTIK